jgi:H+/Cl- antiporter ClcA
MESPGRRDDAPAAASSVRDGEALPSGWQILLIAFVAIAFTAAFMTAYAVLNDVIWSNDYVRSNRWVILVGVLFFSLIVGLAQRYMAAPTVIHGGFVESMKGPTDVHYATFPGTITTSLASLLSGASVGPEGAIAVMVQDISAWSRTKLKVAAGSVLGFDVAALASAFNGIIGNPLFTAVFATELQVGGRSGLTYLTWNLLAGVVGFSFYTLVGLPSFARFLPFPPVTTLQPSYFAWAILLGVLGVMVALVARAAMQSFSTLIQRVFGERVVVRALAAGLVIGVVGVALPELLFSGEAQIDSIVEDPARYGVGMLLLMAVVKLVLLALSVKSGYVGGPTFPLMFSCTMIGMALHLVQPDVPQAILVLCIEGPALALALNAPLTAIVLVMVVGAATPNMIALITFSTVIGLVVRAGVTQAMARRATA